MLILFNECIVSQSQRDAFRANLFHYLAWDAELELPYNHHFCFDFIRIMLVTLQFAHNLTRKHLVSTPCDEDHIALIDNLPQNRAQ